LACTLEIVCGDVSISERISQIDFRLCDHA
jgi:hypothetical protein